MFVMVEVIARKMAGLIYSLEIAKFAVMAVRVAKQKVCIQSFCNLMNF